MISLEEGTFSFSVYAGIGREQFLMRLSMKVSGDSMKGTLEIPDMGLIRFLACDISKGNSCS